MLCLLLITSSQKVIDRSSSDYMAAIIDKHARLDSIKSPKIILAGGSNLAFGIDSKEIENAFGIPVVNMGLHTSLGLDFIISELNYSVNKNDIVIFSPEYFMGKDGSYALEKNTSNFYPPASKYYQTNYLTELKSYLAKNQSTFRNLFSNLISNAKKDTLFQTKGNSTYSRKGFNHYGDVISHLDKVSPAELNDKTLFTYRYWEGIDELNKFYEEAKARGVHVFFTYPDYASSAFSENEKIINHLAADLKKNLEIEILNSPSDFVYPDDYFFDTIYHLNKLGREKRTASFIEILKNNAHVRLCMGKSKSA